MITYLYKDLSKQNNTNCETKISYNKRYDRKRFLKQKNYNCFRQKVLKQMNSNIFIQRFLTTNANIFSERDYLKIRIITY